MFLRSSSPQQHCCGTMYKVLCFSLSMLVWNHLDGAQEPAFTSVFAICMFCWE